MTDRALLQQAIESLERLRTQVDAMNCEPTEELAIEAKIKARLARPEQEPVAWCALNSQGDALIRWDKDKHVGSLKWSPLYASPRPMQRLTDEEIQDIVVKYLPHTFMIGSIGFANAIMDAMIEKNK